MSLTRYKPIHHVVIEEKSPSRMKKVNQFLLLTKLGTGYSSKVYLALKEIKNEEQYYAVKAIRVHERRLNGLSSTNLEREIKLLRSFEHPNIIKLHSVLYAASTDLAYVIMEWANCGTLQNAISKNIKFDETKIASIYMQIALAISYLHSKQIAHRDIKPSNILLFSDGTAKLSDFGISHSFESAESVIGTPSYQSPDLFEEGDDDIQENSSDSDNFIELGNDLCFSFNDEILKEFGSEKNNNNNSFNENEQTCKKESKITFRNDIGRLVDELNDEKEKKSLDPKKGDVWSFGISMYQTAYGVLPYDGKNMFEIVNKINNSPLVIPNNADRKYSPLFVDLIQKMLKKNTDERLSMDEVIRHPFFTRYQMKLSEYQIDQNSDLIQIDRNIGMQKVLFNEIEPFQPPKNLKSQVVKIEAIVCPENYSFSSDLRSASCPSWRYNNSNNNNQSNISQIGKSSSINFRVFL